VRKGWKTVRLGDICKLLNGRAFKQQELLGEGKYPVLRVGNFFSNKNWYYSDFELDEDKYCDDGDLLYAWSASFGPKIWDGGKVIYHYHIWKTAIDETEIDKMFLYYWFDWDSEKIKLDQGAGTTMTHM
jgi:type I restriction enzyme S subunit